VVKITEQQKLELLGLVTLARQHYRVVDQVRDAITAIIGEEDSVLHDAAWDYDVKFEKALQDSQVEVENATT
jgi:hypothetical protein